jgi:hypothetical protein
MKMLRAVQDLDRFIFAMIMHGCGEQRELPEVA